MAARDGHRIEARTARRLRPPEAPLRRRGGAAVSAPAWQVALLVATGAFSCAERHESFPRETNPCATCHGRPDRAGSRLADSAPPTDLAGNVDPWAPGVGAHEQHLGPSTTHDSVPCDGCHRVPTQTLSPGHVDSPLPAEVVLTGLASYDGHTPKYDGYRQTCTDTYCHREARPRWTDPRDSDEACGSCHGVPPTGTHVQYDQCFRCHGAVMAADGTFRQPLRHVDGVVDADETCHSCHGTEQSNAPPPDVAGATEVSSLGVGAHEVHLQDSSRALALDCAACHVVPELSTDLGHIDETPGAEIVFFGVATANGRQPFWSRLSASCSQTWCHQPGDADAPPPPWTSTEGPLGCDGCHGDPPAEPHPQVSACGSCHSAVADLQGKIIDRSRHVDGVVQVHLPEP